MIRLPVRRISSIERMVKENPNAFYNYVVKKMREAIITNASHADFFTFGFTSAKIGATSDQFINLLEEAMTHFVEQEMYEKAATCRDLINKIKITEITN